MPTAVDDSRLGQDRVDQADHREVARHLVDDAFVRRWCQLFEPIHISLTAHLPRRVFLVRKHCFGIIQLDAVVAEQDIVDDTGHELELSSAEDIGVRRKNLLHKRSDGAGHAEEEKRQNALAASPEKAREGKKWGRK